jgi:hypothetical protein
MGLAPPSREEFDLGAHKTGKRVLRRADDRFAAAEQDRMILI